MRIFNRLHFCHEVLILLIASLFTIADARAMVLKNTTSDTWVSMHETQRINSGPNSFTYEYDKGSGSEEKLQGLYELYHMG